MYTGHDHHPSVAPPVDNAAWLNTNQSHQHVHSRVSGTANESQMPALYDMVLISSLNLSLV